MANEQKLVLTVMGSDRPGLIEAISRVVSEHDGNWEASHMARLGGRFAGIMQVAVQEDKSRSLRESLSSLTRLGITITVGEDGDPSAGSESNECWLELVGSDQPNIVHDISEALAKCNVEVLELQSELCDAPVSGGRLFKMQASIRCPEGLSHADLRSGLEDLANSLMVDLTLDD